MKPTKIQQQLLRSLPGVDHILELATGKPDLDDIPKSVLKRSIRSALDQLRAAILADESGMDESRLEDSIILSDVTRRIRAALTPNLRRTVNATGVVVHTNLGRSLLAPEAVENLVAIASRYSNLEFNLAEGRRGSRYSAVEELICEITGAEAALAVNNNAGAVLLCLDTVARGLEVIVSRGELVEIGGSFRIPDVMEKSGGILREVGTTNRTHPRDYENAVGENTGLLLKVHTSNYSVVGFTAEVSNEELVSIGEKFNLPVMEDLGSGTFVDFSEFGLLKEPTVQESVAAGLDLVTFSGDKLLGGPQTGIIAGKSAVIERIKKNPLTRALRIDKLTLAALESTLRLYREPRKAIEQIPTLRMIMTRMETLNRRAQELADRLNAIGDDRLDIQLVDLNSKTGGGALPLLDLRSRGVALRVSNMTANALELAMRRNTPPIIGRIEDDGFVMDLRTVQDDEFPIIQTAVETTLKKA